MNRSLYRLLAHPIYLCVGIVGAKVAGVVGLYCGAKDKEVLNMEAEDWFGLSAVYLLVVLVSIAARILLELDEKES
jgi:ABC-type microcin C transport system permease subunit YejE